MIHFQCCIKKRKTIKKFQRLKNCFPENVHIFLNKIQKMYTLSFLLQAYMIDKTLIAIIFDFYSAF